METKTKQLSRSGMTLLTLTLTGILAFQAGLQARPSEDRSPEQRKAKMEERFHKVSERLGLTEQQQASFKAKREANREEIRALREDDSLSAEEKRDKMKALRESGKEEFESILTDDQRAALEEMKTGRKEKGPKHKAKDKEAKKERFEKMVEELGLTPDQKAVLEAQKAAGRKEMETIKNDTSLSPEEKREKLSELRQSRKGTLAGILTDEQKAKMESLKPKRTKD